MPKKAKVSATAARTRNAKTAAAAKSKAAKVEAITAKTAKTAAPKATSDKSAARTKAAAPKATTKAAAKVTDVISVQLITDRGKIFTLHSRELPRMAMQWTYVVRNRRRWADVTDARAEQAKRALEQVKTLGLKEDDVKELASADVVEVNIPYDEERRGWEARIFPWEYMLSGATKEFRGDRSLTVIRHLECLGDRAVRHAKAPASLLMVESAPGKLRQEFTFDTERSLVKENLSPEKTAISEDETREQLGDRVRKYAPDVVHLTGVDTHQGVRLGALKKEDLKRQSKEDDGYLLEGEDKPVDAVNAPDLAALLNAAKTKPLLVSCNIHNSAARICPMLVAGGASAAIGFQDEFDDALTEKFFATFYQAWRLAGWDLLEAFYYSLTKLREEPRGLQGTGVVLWSDHSLLQPAANQVRQVSLYSPAGKKRARQIQEEIRKEKDFDITPAWWEDDGRRKVRDLIKVKVVPHKTINYSMLHNDRALFESFTISKTQTGRVSNVCIEVMLFVGKDSFQYKTQVDLTDTSKELKDLIKVPLIYAMSTEIRDSVHTSLQVDISWEDRRVHRDTYRVTLLPLNEWRDDDSDRVWLPSFVQPRDPAVARIVDAAQRYLVALQDYGGAGFDGYQSVDLEADDPTVGVDMQVQALWWAIVNDMKLSYINPPPVYTEMSQRIRTPSEILGGRRGTCIDLAMLTAACLEYVEIYPVIFLLEGHAFPGYWRRETYYEDFINFTDEVSAMASKGADKQKDGAQSAQQVAWLLGKDFYDEVLQQVREQKLVPLESTLLAAGGGFLEAAEKGVENLRSRSEFHSLLDITWARTNGVTPIPLRGGDDRDR